MILNSEISRIGDSIYLPQNEGKNSIEPDDFDKASEDKDTFENVVPKADAVDYVGNRSNQQFVANLLISAEILLPQGMGMGQYRWPRCCVVQLRLMATCLEHLTKV